MLTFFQPEQELDVEQTSTRSDLLGLIEKATDFRLRAGKVQLYTVHDFHVELPSSAEFSEYEFQ